MFCSRPVPAAPRTSPRCRRQASQNPASRVTVVGGEELGACGPPWSRGAGPEPGSTVTLWADALHHFRDKAQDLRGRPPQGAGVRGRSWPSVDRGERPGSGPSGQRCVVRHATLPWAAQGSCSCPCDGIASFRPSQVTDFRSACLT